MTSTPATRRVPARTSTADQMTATRVLAGLAAAVIVMFLAGLAGFFLAPEVVGIGLAVVVGLAAAVYYARRRR